MVLSSIQKDIIFQYRDKSYICSILCQQTSDWYNLLISIINIPLIVMSTSLSIINSLNIDNNNMRMTNIIINASFALILALINNFNISEKKANFRSLHLKYIKLTHFIEDKITNELDNCTKEDIRNIINDYDILGENLEYPYPGFIRKRVKKRFFGKKTLPNILNCEMIFVNKDDSISLVKYLNNTNDRKVSIIIEKNENNENNENNNINHNISTKSLFRNKIIQRENSNSNNIEDKLQKEDYSEKSISPIARPNISPATIPNISPAATAIPNTSPSTRSNINTSPSTRSKKLISSRSLFGTNMVPIEDSIKSYNNNDKKISIIIDNKDNIEDRLQREDFKEMPISPLTLPASISSITNNTNF